MESLYMLIPLGVLAAVAILLALWWAVYSGQYEDMEGAAHMILFDRDADGFDVAGEKGTKQKPH